MAKVLLFITLIAGLSYIAGSVANEKNRDFWKVFWLSMFTSPIVGILIALFLQSRKDCTFCLEKIKPEATVCRHCGKDVIEVNIENADFEDVESEKSQEK